jgi:hypothetical protein
VETTLIYNYITIVCNIGKWLVTHEF